MAAWRPIRPDRTYGGPPSRPAPRAPERLPRLPSGKPQPEAAGVLTQPGSPPRGVLSGEPGGHQALGIDSDPAHPGDLAVEKVLVAGCLSAAGADHQGALAGRKLPPAPAAEAVPAVDEALRLAA